MGAARGLSSTILGLCGVLLTPENGWSKRLKTRETHALAEGTQIAMSNFPLDPPRPPLTRPPPLESAHASQLATPRCLGVSSPTFEAAGYFFILLTRTSSKNELGF